MARDYNNEDLDAAAKMIRGAFGNEPLKDHPLAFVQEPPFKDLIDGLEAVFQEHDSDPRTILCALTEILMRSTGYNIKDPQTGLLAARAAPIIRQLVFEQKQATDILVIISAMITHLALHADCPRQE
jgi:hypothetical protein